MVIKVYTSGISGNKEVKKRQQRIMMILDSKNISYEAIDITEPGKEDEKHFMQDNANAKDAKHPLPPQIFNDEQYCGDYDGFDVSNENDELEVFLKIPLPPSPVIEPPPVINGSTEHSDEKDTNDITPGSERNEDIISNMVPNTIETEQADEEEEEPEVEEEESVHGFCYTPALAKRLEKALKARILKEKPKTVHGYCYTPSLAARLTKALEGAFLRKKSEHVKKEDIIDDENAMDEDKIETESAAINDNDVAENDDNKENGGNDEDEEE